MDLPHELMLNVLKQVLPSNPNPTVHLWDTQDTSYNCLTLRA